MLTNNADTPGSQHHRAALCVALCQATVMMIYVVLLQMLQLTASMLQVRIRLPGKLPVSKQLTCAKVVPLLACQNDIVKHWKGIVIHCVNDMCFLADNTADGKHAAGQDALYGGASGKKAASTWR